MFMRGNCKFCVTDAIKYTMYIDKHSCVRITRARNYAYLCGFVSVSSNSKFILLSSCIEPRKHAHLHCDRSVKISFYSTDSTTLSLFCLCLSQVII